MLNADECRKIVKRFQDSEDMFKTFDAQIQVKASEGHYKTVLRTTRYGLESFVFERYKRLGFSLVINAPSPDDVGDVTFSISWEAITLNEAIRKYLLDHFVKPV